jgi:hypothetical protein
MSFEKNGKQEKEEEKEKKKRGKIRWGEIDLKRIALRPPLLPFFSSLFITRSM